MKKLFRIGLILVAALSIFLLAGCGKSEGDEFIGTWKHVYTDGDIGYITVNKSGETYVVKRYYFGSIERKYFGQAPYIEKFTHFEEKPAKYEKGRLVTRNTELFIEDKYLKNTGIFNDHKALIPFEKESDKVKTFEELRPEGFPDPK